MPDTIRTFIAVEVPEAQKDALARLRDRLAPTIAGSKWVSRAQYHATLAFLGDVPERDLVAINNAVDRAAAEVEPLEVRLLGLGAFPNPGRPRNIWVGFDGPGLDGFSRLHQAVHQALGAVGHRPDGRDAFFPHVTLARFKTGPGRSAPPDLRRVIPTHDAWSTDWFTIAEVVTFASELRPEGPVYTALGRSRLGIRL